MSRLPIIETARLFPELDARLVELLKSLSPEEWTRATIVPQWNVQQIAAHLLDTAVRRLSMCRDDWRPGRERISSERELVALINRLNAEGVAVFGRVSPALLVEMTERVTPQLADYVASLDPEAPAAFAVSWAGEHQSANWFDVARELTERWHHQQQIRLATNRPGIMTARLYGPVLETFMRVLPHTYRHIDAPEGTVCDFVVPGEAGGRWRLTRQAKAWTLAHGTNRNGAVCTCTIPPDLAWRLFTKGASTAETRERVDIRGDERLGQILFTALAIVG